MRRSAIAASVVGMVLMTGPLSAQPKSIGIDLASMATNQPPSDFESAQTGAGQPPRWVVVEDASATAGRAIAQTDPDRTDNRFPLAIYKPFSTKNVEVSLRFKPVAGRVDQAGGIAVRLAGPNDYYVVRANALENNVRFYRVVKGKREQLAGANLEVKSGTWHTLAIKAEGDRFTISFNGRQLYEHRDTTFGDPGKVALWTKADSVTHFDRIAITALP